MNPKFGKLVTWGNNPPRKRDQTGGCAAIVSSIRPWQGGKGREKGRMGRLLRVNSTRYIGNAKRRALGDARTK